MRELPDHGLMVDGHLPRAEVLAAALEHLVASGMSQMAAEDALVDRHGLIGRAWWGGDDVGFVDEGSNGLREADTVSGRAPSRPVTVVHVEVYRDPPPD